MRSMLRLAVFGEFGDATRPDDHTSHTRTRPEFGGRPPHHTHPDAVLTRLAAQRSNVQELPPQCSL